MTRKRFSRICRAARFKESFIKELVKAIQDNGCSYAEVFLFLKPVIAETCFLHNIPAPRELRPYVIGSLVMAFPFRNTVAMLLLSIFVCSYVSLPAYRVPAIFLTQKLAWFQIHAGFFSEP